jgi:hypothetical protein
MIAMKKLLIPIAFMFMLMVIDIVAAVTISVTCNPQVIPSPGGTTTITVTCDQGGSGSITVITPGGDNPSSISISIPARGGSVSKVYPTDFPSPASTAETGEYEVVVVLSGYKYTASFWVSFMVVPQTPLGVIAVIAACFAALGIKRVQVKKK